MFRDVNQNFLKNLQDRAKREAREMKKCRQSGMKTVSATVQLNITGEAKMDFLSPKGSARSAISEVSFAGRSLTARTNSGSPLDRTQISSSSIKKSNVHKVTRKLTIAERLAMAHDEAILERKLDNVKRNGKTGARHPQESRVSYLTKNFPLIGDSRGGSDDSSSVSSAAKNKPNKAGIPKQEVCVAKILRFIISSCYFCPANIGGMDPSSRD